MEVKKFAVGKSCLAGAIALALLTACGGGGGGGGGNGGGGGGGGGNPLTVSGAAVKGIIKNGLVSIYGVSNGVRGSTPLVTGRTSTTDGTYSLQVSGYSGPVVVEVTALAPGDSGYPSRMVCDIPGTDSCGADIDFGDDYNLGSDFVLKAVVPQVTTGGTVTANVTALTNMAAALAESTGITTDSAYMANTQVADLFSITGDLTTLTPVDVTDPDALADATEAERRAALLSASILAAAVADGSTVDAALTDFSAAFVENQGQLVNNETSNTNTTTLEEIFEQTQTLLTDELSEVDELNQLGSSISADLNTASNATPGSVTTAEPNDEVLSDGFRKAKGLVQDLRDVSTAATFDEIRDGATDFSDNLAAAGEVINDDTRRAMDALTRVAEAISQAAFDQAEAGTYVAENGVEITVTVDDNSVSHYSFDGDILVSDEQGDHTVAVTLTGIGHITLNETVEEIEGGEDGAVDLNADLDLTGVVTTPSATLTLREGSNILVTGMEETWTESNGETQSQYNDQMSADQLGFDLNVTLAQREGENPVTFTGSLALNVTGFSTESSESNSGVCTGEGMTLQCTESHADASSISFSTLSIDLNGEFSQGDDSFAATFNLGATNNGYEQSESSSWISTWSAASGGDFSQEETESEESADQFVAINFTLDMEAVLPGISDDVAVRLTGDRNALSTGAASLALAWDGKRLEANLVLSGPEDAHAAALTITNQDGATLVWNDSNVDDDNDVIQGVISADGAQQATFAEENDVVVIRYNGGYVESF